MFLCLVVLWVFAARQIEVVFLICRCFFLFAARWALSATVRNNSNVPLMTQTLKLFKNSFSRDYILHLQIEVRRRNSMKYYQYYNQYCKIRYSTRISTTADVQQRIRIVPSPVCCDRILWWAFTAKIKLPCVTQFPDKHGANLMARHESEILKHCGMLNHQQSNIIHWQASF